MGRHYVYFMQIKNFFFQIFSVPSKNWPAQKKHYTLGGRGPEDAYTLGGGGEVLMSLSARIHVREFGFSLNN